MVEVNDFLDDNNDGDKEDNLSEMPNDGTVSDKLRVTILSHIFDNV